MNRDQLYDLVWSTPMIHAAKRFGISDVALRKTCVRHDVPTPPLGYWAKLAHGKKVRQPALPALKPNVRDHIQLLARPQVEVPATVVKAAEEAHAREAAAIAKIIVPSERPDRLHPVALALDARSRNLHPTVRASYKRLERDCPTSKWGATRCFEPLFWSTAS